MVESYAGRCEAESDRFPCRRPRAGPVPDLEQLVAISMHAGSHAAVVSSAVKWLSPRPDKVEIDAPNPCNPLSSAGGWTEPEAVCIQIAEHAQLSMVLRTSESPGSGAPHSEHPRTSQSYQSFASDHLPALNSDLAHSRPSWHDMSDFCGLV